MSPSQSVAATDAHTYRGRIAGVSVAIHCTSSACTVAAAELSRYFDEPLGRTLGGGQPALQIEIGQGELPSLGQGSLSFTHGLVRGFRTEHGMRLHSPGCGLLVDNAAGAIYCLLHGAEHHQLHRSVHVTLFIGLALLLRQRGRFHMHAASLRAPDGRGLLVVGEGGAGKTTLALAMTRAGLELLGDDALWLATTRSKSRWEVVAYPARRPIQATANTLEMLPSLTALTRHPLPGSDKYRVSVSRGSGRVTPHWLIFPEIVQRGRSQLMRLRPADAFGPLLRSSALLLAEGVCGREKNVEVAGALLGQAQSLALAAGRDVLDPNDELPWARQLYSEDGSTHQTPAAWSGEGAS